MSFVSRNAAVGQVMSSLVELIKSQLGTCERIKCVIHEDGFHSDMFSCTALLLQNLDVEHPVYNVINSVIQSHHESFGNCCKTLLVMAGLWYRELENLIDLKFSPTDISQALEEGLEGCVSHLLCSSAVWFLDEELNEWTNGASENVSYNWRTSVGDFHESASCLSEKEELDGMSQTIDLDQGLREHCINSETNTIMKNGNGLSDEDDISWFFEEKQVFRDSNDCSKTVSTQILGSGIPVNCTQIALQLPTKSSEFGKTSFTSCSSSSHLTHNSENDDDFEDCFSDVDSGKTAFTGRQCLVVNSYTETTESNDFERNNCVGFSRKIDKDPNLTALCCEMSNVCVSASSLFPSSWHVTKPPLTRRSHCFSDTNDLSFKAKSNSLETKYSNESAILSGSDISAVINGNCLHSAVAESVQDNTGSFLSRDLRCLDSVDKTASTETDCISPTDIKSLSVFQTPSFPSLSKYSRNLSASNDSKESGSTTGTPSSKVPSGGKKHSLVSYEEIDRCSVEPLFQPSVGTSQKLNLNDDKEESNGSAALQVEEECREVIGTAFQKSAISYWKEIGDKDYVSQMDSQEVFSNVCRKSKEAEEAKLNRSLDDQLRSDDVRALDHTISIRRNVSVRSAACISTTSLFEQRLAALGLKLSHGADAMMELVVKMAYRQLVENTPQRFDINLIHTSCLDGFREDRTCIVEGLLLHVNADQIPLIAGKENPRLSRALLVNGDLTPSFCHQGYRNVAKVTTVLNKLSPVESKSDIWQNRVVDVIKQLDVGVLFVRGRVDEDLLFRCQLENVVMLEGVPCKALNVLSYCTNAPLNLYVTNCTECSVACGIELKLWMNDWISMRKSVKEQFYVTVKPLSSTSPVQTVVVCHPLSSVARVMEEQFWHCANRLLHLVETKKVLIGGGTAETICAAFLEKSADDLSRDNTSAQSSAIAVVYRTVANGFRQFTRILSKNLIHSRTGFVPMDSEAVFDDLESKLEAWRSASFLVSLLLRIDMEIVANSERKIAKNQDLIIGYL